MQNRSSPTVKVFYLNSDAVPGSDADLLILLSRRRLGFLERISRYMPHGCGIGVDILPYTVKEFRHIVRGRPRLAQAIAEGVVLFCRQQEPVPQQ